MYSSRTKRYSFGATVFLWFILAMNIILPVTLILVVIR